MIHATYTSKSSLESSIIFKSMVFLKPKILTRAKLYTWVAMLLSTWKHSPLKNIFQNDFLKRCVPWLREEFFICALRYREVPGWENTQHLPMKADLDRIPRHPGAQARRGEPGAIESLREYLGFEWWLGERKRKKRGKYHDKREIPEVRTQECWTINIFHP